MRSCWIFASCLLTLSAGCTALVEGTLSGRNGGMDAGMPGNDTGPLPDMGPTPDMGTDAAMMASACNGLPDGIHCLVEGIDEPFVCLDDICQLSRCGDGIADTRMQGSHPAEECDDGNGVPGDGCEMDCTYSCHVQSDCTDTETCNGSETCGPMHACEAGTPVPDSPSVPCMIGTIVARCQGGVCRAGTCGDGTMDPGEECDDHNLNDGDGCDMDCTYTCVDDGACQDGNRCNGDETCDLTNHTCLPATTPLTCMDPDACTTDTCDPTMGCVFTSMLVDLDGDGSYAPNSCGQGDDCDDTNAAAHPGAAPETCGATVDLNCDGVTGMMTTFYRDCDGDDYAANTTGSMMACSEPAAVSGCTGGWTTRVPGTGSTDCLDSSIGGSVHPSQAGYFGTNPSGFTPAFDYNCSGTATLEFALSSSATTPPNTHYSAVCTDLRGTSCTGDVWYVGTTAPTCGSTTTASVCGYHTLLGRTTCGRASTTGYQVRCH